MAEYIETFKRKEIKYLLSGEQYEQLFPFMQEMASVDQYGKTRIQNIYFDTPDYRLIRTSLEKPIYKEKLRLRTYGDTNGETNSFIEIKKKYDGIVYKRRVSGDYDHTFRYLIGKGQPIDDSQISQEIAGFLQMYRNLRPAMRIGYDRIAMAGIDDPGFRVTFDTKITWSTDCLDLREQERGNQILADGCHLMEIKVKDALPQKLARKLAELSIFPNSFSKYGRGYEAMISKKKGLVGYV
ncbi:polyphosphate polymerase domain-containing protein [Agathobacter ruminis]|uniref:Molecular chaperone n=1 Tax=Agathobacter ruminis TaxID=1712665 RepID=A0A2G3E4B4_9FIRM|nr:polyphosphate polymerase domain-containing protein [Agathobacter ruminis]MDC7301227.1 polyphosphate polymerase domain-containing protein [Agathobacter ruminis]PHU38094.1 molecular chaperone [Agathobacter ruminis]